MKSKAQRATYHREQAKKCQLRHLESVKRSVTDGFLSQSVAQLVAREHLAKAKIIENGGVATFPGLYIRATGERANAKLIKGKFGLCWAFCDANGDFTGQFLSDCRTTKGNLWKNGFEVRDETAKAGVTTKGWDVVIFRTDGK